MTGYSDLPQLPPGYAYVLDDQNRFVLDDQNRFVIAQGSPINFLSFIRYFFSFLSEFARDNDPVLRQYIVGPESHIFMVDSHTEAQEPGWWVVLFQPPPLIAQLLHHPNLRFALESTVAEQDSVVYTYPPVNSATQTVIPVI